MKIAYASPENGVYFGLEFDPVFRHSMYNFDDGLCDSSFHTSPSTIQLPNEATIGNR